MLVSRLKAALDMDFPLAYVMEQPTIEALAEKLQGPSSSRSVMKHMVPINPGGTRTPMFLVSGAGGYGFIFQELIQRLGPDQPIFVLQAVGSRRERDIRDYTIEEMAEIYEEEILPACGEGPVIFAGYSFGSLVAFELCRRFEARGRKVERLISFDGFAPRYPRLLPLHQRLVSHLRALTEANQSSRREYLAARFENVKRRGFKLMGRAHTEQHLDAADAELNTHISRLEASLWSAQRRYDPAYTIDCPLLLIRCENPEKWVGSDMANPLYGWESCVKGAITTVTIPGEHLNLFQADNPQRMADAIVQASRS
jgi:thioesterase domain-containing protein